MIKKRTSIILFVIVLTAIAFHLGQHQEKLAQRERVREKNRAKGQEAGRQYMYDKQIKEGKEKDRSKEAYLRIEKETLAVLADIKLKRDKIRADATERFRKADALDKKLGRKTYYGACGRMYDVNHECGQLSNLMVEYVKALPDKEVYFFAELYKIKCVNTWKRPHTFYGKSTWKNAQQVQKREFARLYQWTTLYPALEARIFTLDAVTRKKVLDLIPNQLPFHQYIFMDRVKNDGKKYEFDNQIERALKGFATGHSTEGPFIRIMTPKDKQRRLRFKKIIEEMKARELKKK